MKGLHHGQSLLRQHLECLGLGLGHEIAHRRLNQVFQEIDIESLPRIGNFQASLVHVNQIIENLGGTLPDSTMKDHLGHLHEFFLGKRIGNGFLEDLAHALAPEG